LYDVVVFDHAVLYDVRLSKFVVKY
jgi:hypothetical protein